MIPSFLCIPHIPVGYAGGRATHGAIAKARSNKSSCLRGELMAFLLISHLSENVGLRFR
jgi:hypothetical protein